jgi:hypothetical protein
MVFGVLVKGTREPLGTLLPTGVALLFAAGLFGLPSCQRTGDGLLEADIRRTDRLVAERRFDVALEVLLELGQQNPDHALIARHLRVSMTASAASRMKRQRGRTSCADPRRSPIRACG